MMGHYSVKQLAKKLSEEQFDVKGFPAVMGLPDGSRYRIVDVYKDDDNRVVVLSTDEDSAQIITPDDMARESDFGGK